MILYRPVGLQELALIYDSGMKAFPARLPQQPIFYPVLQLEYARQTASGWNAKNGQLAGYVTQFKVEDDYIGKFEEHVVGKSAYQELWIPAEEMEEFNRHIVGHIKVVEAHFGNAFEGFVPEQFGLQGKNAVEQFTLLANSFLYKRMEFYLELKRNHKAVFLNYLFWHTYEFKNPGLKEKILQAIKEAWLTSFPQTPLPAPAVQEEPLPGKQADVVEPLQEEIEPDEETDSDDWVDEIKPLKQTYAQTLIRPVHEERPPTEPTEPEASEDPVDEEITPVEKKVSPLSIKPVKTESTSPKRPGSYPWERSVRKDVTSLEPGNAHAVVKPVPQEITLPKRTRSHFLPGIKLGLSGEYAEAIEELSEAAEEDPIHVAAHTSLGVAFHRVGEEERALTCYETALKIDPNDAEAHYFRANILYDQGHVREAIAEYTKAIGLQPALIDAHQGAAPQDRLTDYVRFPAEMRRIAKPARRILDLNQSLEADPRQAALFKERAAAYSQLLNYEQSIADYTAFLALQPDDASALHARGRAYEQLGQLDRAQEDYQRSIAINSQISDAYIQRGITLGSMGNFRQSIASLTEGIRLAPQNPDGYFNRGAAYFQQGDLESAIADFSHVIRLSPGDEAAYYWRGIAHEEAGRPREAIADYRQFLSLSPDPRAREEIEQRLRQWHVGKQENAASPRENRESQQKEKQTPAKKPDQDLDIHAVLVALGERAVNSLWFGSEVECYGDKAEELHSFASQDRPIEGRDLLDITSGIRRTVQGDFYAVDKGAASHWLFLHAWDGNGFYIETNDTRSKGRLKTQFAAAEEVDGASPPYAGLLIRIGTENEGEPE